MNSGRVRQAPMMLKAANALFHTISVRRSSNLTTKQVTIQKLLLVHIAIDQVFLYYPKVPYQPYGLKHTKLFYLEIKVTIVFFSYVH